MPALYDRHTPIHHRVYIHDDMELPDWRELALILIPLFYVVSYELLHMSYHLPRTSRVGRNPVQRWNMNVTVPLWDIVRRTRLTERAVLPVETAATEIPSKNEASTPARSPAIQ